MVCLHEYLLAIKRADSLLQEIQRTESRAERMTTMSDGMPHGRQVRSKVESGAVALVILKEKYTAMLEQLQQMKSELADMISALPDANQRAVLRLRYIYMHKPAEFAARIGMCERSVNRHIMLGKEQLLRMFPDRIRLE